MPEIGSMMLVSGWGALSVSLWSSYTILIILISFIFKGTSEERI